MIMNSHVHDYDDLILILLVRNLRFFRLCGSETPHLELTRAQCCLLEFHICETNIAT